MAEFIKLEDGSLLNLDHVLRIHPATRSNRIDFVTGGHVQLNELDADKVRKQASGIHSLESENRINQQIADALGRRDEQTAHAIAPAPLPGRNPNAETLDLNQKPKKRRGRPPKKTEEKTQVK